MTKELLDLFMQSLGASHWGSFLIIPLMLLESAPIIGLFIPGVFLMVGLGSLSGTQYLSFVDCVVYASIGALLGDSLGYWLGRLGHSEKLWSVNTSRTLAGRRRTKALFDRHGRWAVFLGRFVWFLHPTVPLIAGAVGIRPFWFYLADIPAVILWVLTYAAIGHWLSGAAQKWTLEFFTIAGILIALALLTYAWRYWKQRRAPTADKTAK